MATRLKEPPFPEQENFVSPRGQVSVTWLAWFRDTFKRVNERATVTGDGDEDHVVIFDGVSDLIDSGLTKPASNFVGETDAQALANKSYEGIPGTNIVDKSADEDIAGSWRIPKLQSVTHTTEVYLTDDDFGKVIKIDSSSDVTVVLPPGTYIDQWLTVIRLGSGSVRIQAPGEMTIAHSQPGGSAVCQDTRAACNLTLYLASATQYAIIEGFGIWYLSKSGGASIGTPPAQDYFSRTLTANLIAIGGVITDSDKLVIQPLAAGMSIGGALAITWRRSVRTNTGDITPAGAVSRSTRVARVVVGSIDFNGTADGAENVLFGGVDATWGGDDITW